MRQEHFAKRFPFPISISGRNISTNQVYSTFFLEHPSAAQCAFRCLHSSPAKWGTGSGFLTYTKSKLLLFKDRKPSWHRKQNNEAWPRKGEHLCQDRPRLVYVHLLFFFSFVTNYRTRNRVQTSSKHLLVHLPDRSCSILWRAESHESESARFFRALPANYDPCRYKGMYDQLPIEVDTEDTQKNWHVRAKKKQACNKHLQSIISPNFSNKFLSSMSSKSLLRPPTKILPIWPR